MKSCGGVFEGGGVRGIAHVGAAWEFERAGFSFGCLAGSSAGAIAAALLAAGYSAGELKQELETLDYERLKGRDFLDRFGALGKLCSILFHFGIYDTDYLEQWVGELLSRRGVRDFNDIKNKGRILKITASDLTAGHLLILPDDLAELGIDPGSFSVASAVRMSTGIPIFFEPMRLRDGEGKVHLIVDGGLISNFPIWVLDDGEGAGKYPIFGFQFTDMTDAGRKACTCTCQSRWNLVDYLKAIAAICMDATDYSHARAGDRQRTVRIPVSITVGNEAKTVHAVDFSITREESSALFENGKRAAEKFLKTWNFSDWEKKYRL